MLPSTSSSIFRHPSRNDLSGSDGTRTRDLRGDRPVRAQPVQLAPTRNYRLEQAFPRRAKETVRIVDLMTAVVEEADVAGDELARAFMSGMPAQAIENVRGER